MRQLEWLREWGKNLACRSRTSYCTAVINCPSKHSCDGKNEQFQEWRSCYFTRWLLCCANWNRSLTNFIKLVYLRFATFSLVMRQTPEESVMQTRHGPADRLTSLARQRKGFAKTAPVKTATCTRRQTIEPFPKYHGNIIISQPPRSL